MSSSILSIMQETDANAAAPPIVRSGPPSLTAKHTKQKDNKKEKKAKKKKGEKKEKRDKSGRLVRPLCNACFQNASLVSMHHVIEFHVNGSSVRHPDLRTH